MQASHQSLPHNSLLPHSLTVQARTISVFLFVSFWDGQRVVLHSLHLFFGGIFTKLLIRENFKRPPFRDQLAYGNNFFFNIFHLCTFQKLKKIPQFCDQSRLLPYVFFLLKGHVTLFSPFTKFSLPFATQLNFRFDFMPISYHSVNAKVVLSWGVMVVKPKKAVVGSKFVRVQTPTFIQQRYK